MPWSHPKKGSSPDLGILLVDALMILGWNYSKYSDLPRIYLNAADGRNPAPVDR